MIAQKVNHFWMLPICLPVAIKGLRKAKRQHRGVVFLFYGNFCIARTLAKELKSPAKGQVIFFTTKPTIPTAEKTHLKCVKFRFESGVGYTGNDPIGRL